MWENFIKQLSDSNLDSETLKENISKIIDLEDKEKSRHFGLKKGLIVFLCGFLFLLVLAQIILPNLGLKALKSEVFLAVCGSGVGIIWLIYQLFKTK